MRSHWSRVLGLLVLVSACGGLAKSRLDGGPRETIPVLPDAGAGGGRDAVTAGFGGATANATGGVTDGFGGANANAAGTTTASEPGPARLGMGLYELTIVPVSESCDPASEVGDMGPVVVEVSAPDDFGLHVFAAFCEGYDGGCRRGEWSSTSFFSAFPTLSFDNSMTTGDTIPSCSARFSVAERLTTYNGELIDAEVTRRFEDLDAPCSIERIYPEIQKDCASVRVYRYRWIRACAERRDAQDCD